MVDAKTWVAPCWAALLALMVGACASQSTLGPDFARSAATSDRSKTIVLGEQSGLGISGVETPPVLKAVAVAPYAVSTPADCGALSHEIVILDELLGPDVDILADPKARADFEHQATQAFGSAVRGAIPYRWALRWMTGAGRLDRELRQAVLAGTARRGFLKGMRLATGCAVSPQRAAQ